MSDSYDNSRTGEDSRVVGNPEFNIGGGDPVVDSVTGQTHFGGEGMTGSSGNMRSEIKNEMKHGHGLTGDNQFSSSGGRGGLTGGDEYSSGGRGGLTGGDEYSSGGRGGLTGGDEYSSGGRGGVTGDNQYSSGRGNNLTDNYGSNTTATDYSRDTSNLDSGRRDESFLQNARDRASGGMTGDSRSDDRHHNQTGDGDQYGNPVGDKRIDNNNITRSGNDFTGGAVATGGAYTNPNVKTGLTGREGTSTGVQDQDGEPTKKVGMMQKVKNAIGGHNNDDQ